MKKNVGKRIVCALLAVIMVFTLCACTEQAREDTKTLLKDVFKALPGGLKEAKERVVDPAIEDIKNDAKEIYDDVKPSWEEAFPKDEGNESPEDTQQEPQNP